jgi:hypothetical protein
MFRDGSVKVSGVPLLSDVDEFIARGSTFDRAIITEEAITEDGNLTEIDDMLVVVEKFAEEMSGIFDDKEAVFILNSEELADAVLTQLFMSSERVRVVLRSRIDSLKMSYLRDLTLVRLQDFKTNQNLKKSVFTQGAVSSKVDEDLEVDNEEELSFEDEEKGNEESKADFSDLDGLFGEDADDISFDDEDKFDFGSDTDEPDEKEGDSLSLSEEDDSSEEKSESIEEKDAPNPLGNEGELPDFSGLFDTDTDSEFETENSQNEPNQDELYTSEKNENSDGQFSAGAELFDTSENFGIDQTPKTAIPDPQNSGLSPTPHSGEASVNDLVTTPPKKGLLGGIFRGKGKGTVTPKVDKPRPTVKPKRGERNGAATLEELKRLIESYKYRGKVVLFTGTKDSGTSTLVANLANIVSKLGGTALVVDLVYNGRTQAYMTGEAYRNLHSAGADTNDLRLCLNNKKADILNYAATVRQGYNLLGTGLGVDFEKPKDIVRNIDNVKSFLYSAKSTYNLVFIDAQFSDIVGEFKEFEDGSDIIVLNTTSTTKAMLEFMLLMCNIEDSQLRENFFSNSKLVFNKATDNRFLLGRQFKSYYEILTELDGIVQNLTTYTAGFSEMNIVGAIPYDASNDKMMFTDRLISDGKEYTGLFAEILLKILK